MKCLHQLSRQGCMCSCFFQCDDLMFFSPIGTIVFSIHQPRYSIFKLFDTVLLLTSGHPIYLGPSASVLPYFFSYGFKPDEHENPADFVLDILIGCDQNSLATLQNGYRNRYMHMNEPVRSVKLDDHTSNPIVSRSNIHDLYFVCLRTLRNTMRDPAMVVSQMIVALLLALLTGLVFNQIKPTVETGVQNRLGVLFFIVINQIFSTTTALEPLVQERALFIHVNSPCQLSQHTPTVLLLGTCEWLLSSIHLFHCKTDL